MTSTVIPQDPHTNVLDGSPAKVSTWAAGTVGTVLLFAADDAWSALRLKPA